jgi:hypothetical protein
LNQVVGGGNALTVNTSGATTLGGTISGITTLLTDAPGSTLLGSSVSASGSISLLDSVMALFGSSTLESLAGQVLLGGTVDGPGSLIIAAAGTTTFAGAVGGTSALQSLTVTGSSVVNGGSVVTSGDLQFLNGVSMGAHTVMQSGGTMYLSSGANAGLFNLSMTAPDLQVGSGATVTGANVSLAGAISGAGALSLSATDTLTIRGALWTEGALDLGAPALIALQGTINCLGDLTLRSALQVSGDCVITSRANGNVIFQSTVNGTQYQADSLLVNSSGLTSFDMSVGSLMRMYELHTNHPGTIRVAPSANAFKVIYGELEDPTPPPDPTSGGVVLTQSVSGVWYQPTIMKSDSRLGGVRKESEVDVELDRELSRFIGGDRPAGEFLSP